MVLPARGNGLRNFLEGSFDLLASAPLASVSWTLVSLGS